MKLSQDVYLTTLSKIHKEHTYRRISREKVFVEGTRDRTSMPVRKEPFALTLVTSQMNRNIEGSGILM